MFLTEEQFLHWGVQLHMNPEGKSLMDSNTGHFSMPCNSYPTGSKLCRSPMVSPSTGSAGNPREDDLRRFLPTGCRLSQRLTEVTGEAMPTEYSLATKAATLVIGRCKWVTKEKNNLDGSKYEKKLYFKEFSINPQISRCLTQNMILNFRKDSKEMYQKRFNWGGTRRWWPLCVNGGRLHKRAENEIINGRNPSIISMSW